MRDGRSLKRLGFGWLAVSLLLGSGCRINFGDDGDERVWNWHGFGENLEVRMVGELRFDEHDSDVEWISEDGRLRIRDGRWTADRELIALPAVDGSPLWTYREGGEVVPLDAEAIVWREAVIARLVRHTSLGAKPRARRFLHQQGVSGVLEEVARLESQSASEAYYAVLIEEAELSADDAARVTRHAVEQLSSSSRLGRTLERLSELHPMEDALTGELFKAGARLGSSSRQQSLMTKMIDQRPIPDDVADELAEAVEKIGSSSRQSTVLQALWAKESLSPAVLEASLGTVRSIDSSSRQSQALLKLLERETLSEQNLLAIVDVSRHIDSSSRRAGVLVGVVSSGGDRPPVLGALIQAAGRLDSSSETLRVLGPVLELEQLSEDSLVEVLNIIPSISSSSVRRSLLDRAVARPESSDRIWQRYLRAVGSLGSSSDQASLLISLLERPEISRAVIDSAADTARNEISSESRRERVLSKVANRLAG